MNEAENVAEHPFIIRVLLKSDQFKIKFRGAFIALGEKLLNKLSIFVSLPLATFDRSKFHGRDPATIMSIAIRTKSQSKVAKID